MTPSKGRRSVTSIQAISSRSRLAAALLVGTSVLCVTTTAWAQETPPAGFTPGTTPDAAIPKNFQVALDNIRNHPDNTTGKFADLLAAFPPRPDVA